MESCGYKSKDIQEILIELYEVFDFCSVEEAADYYEHSGSPDPEPIWPEAWRNTKGRHSLPGAVFSRFPTGQKGN